RITAVRITVGRAVTAGYRAAFGDAGQIDVDLRLIDVRSILQLQAWNAGVLLDVGRQMRERQAREVGIERRQEMELVRMVRLPGADPVRAVFDVVAQI